MDFSGAFSWMNIRFLLEGLKVTVEVSLFSIIFSFLIGGLTGVIRFANIPFFSKILGVVIDIIRNLPLLLIIFFTYFALPQIGIQMNIFWSAVAALTILSQLCCRKFSELDSMLFQKDRWKQDYQRD